MTEKLIRQAFQYAAVSLPQLRYYDTTASTNDDALKWADEGAIDGAIVVAERQTSGRGRLGRRWVTQPGSALAFSLVLRPNRQEMQTVSLFSPLGAMALHQTLLDDYGLQACIKWPNDVLLQGKKISGILAESSWLGGELSAVVLGIGINISPEAVPPPDMARYPASCIEAFSDRKVERWTLLAHVVANLHRWRSRLLSDEFNETWNRYLAFRGEQVMLQNSSEGEELRGVLTGVDMDGSLMVRSEDGGEHHISAGDVHLRPIRS